MSELPPFELFGAQAADLGPGTWLLEASAGTGKTYTIVGIVVRLVAEAGIPIERCVVMTFTRAATAELRERLRSGLHRALLAIDEQEAAEPGDPFLADFCRRHRGDRLVRRRLLLALAGLDAALVATIHGVCHRLLGDHALQTGVALASRLAGDPEAWRQAAVHDLLRDWNHRLKAEAAGLLGDALDPARIGEGCVQLERHPDIVFEGAEPITPEEIGERLDHARRQWPAWQQAIIDFYGERAAILGAHPDYQPRAMAERLRAIGRLLAAGPDAEQLRALLLPYLKPNQDCRRLGREHLHALARSDWWQGLKGLLTLRAGVDRQLLKAYHGRLQARPREGEELFYDDLLIALDTALQGPSREELRAAVRSRYELVLVDEFQDTDARQWRILRELFAGAGRRLFLIGDPKQAIYAFRGADVHAYLQVAQQADLRAYTLGCNHRSDTGLVEAVNHLFDRGDQSFVEEGIRFQPVAARQGQRLRPGPALDPAPMQCWWLAAQPTIDESRRQLAEAVAAEILRLLGDAELADDGEWRRLRERDIAVLVRSHGEGELIARALAALPQPVPSVRNLRRSVFAGREAFACAALLSAVLAPHRARRVRAAAVTRLCRLEPAALLVDDDDDGGALTALVAQLRTLRGLWFERGFLAMWQELLDHGCGSGRPQELLAGDSDGERAITDLLHLGDLLGQAERQDGLSPEALVDWLEQRLAAPERGSDDQLLRLDRDDEAVRILTIHASKGLQFPVVFAPFLWGSRPVDERQPYHQEHCARWFFGQAPPAVERARRHEALAESLRLAYVALTRAEHRCYTAFVPQPARSRRAPGCTTSALTWLADGVERCPAHALGETLKPLVGDRAWQQQLCRRLAHPCLAVGPCPDHPAPPPRPQTDRQAADRRPVAAWPSQPRERWFSSYSGLVRNRPVDEPDHDQVRTEAGPADDPLPRGARFGTAVHTVFEHLDFAADRATVRAVCGRELAAQGFDPQLAEPCARMVERVLHSPVPVLGGDLRAAARLRDAELDVLLPVDRPAPIADCFRAHGGEWAHYADDIADLLLPGGYFTAIIDLVFKHGERYHLLDWKTNDLGKRGGYHHEAMRAEMHHHHYVLQYHLYAVALHRMLRLRLPGYDYDRHVGEAHYVFVRGVDGSGAGWYHARPSRAMIEALDDCFAEMRHAP